MSRPVIMSRDDEIRRLREELSETKKRNDFLADQLKKALEKIERLRKEKENGR